MEIGASDLLAVCSGSLAGFILGVIGGGGSILAVRCSSMWWGESPHVAIGTGSVAVALSEEGGQMTREHPFRASVRCPA
jgi:hypothetical protein